MIRFARPTWSLRSLLLLPLVMAPLCVVLSSIVNQYLAEERALAALGAVAHEIDFRSTAPRWLTGLGVGSRYLRRVRGIAVWGDERDAEAAKVLSAFDRLEYVHVRDPATLSTEATTNRAESHYAFVAAAVSSAASHNRLQELRIMFSGIDDKMMRTVSELRSLRNLVLWRGSGGRCGVRGIRNLSGLTSLSLHWFYVSECGARELCSLPALATLDLANCDISGTAATQLSLLRALRHLDLTDCRGITDATVPAFAQVSDLEWLSLAGCGISDQALGVIGASPLSGTLRSLNLAGTRITDRGINALCGCRSLRYLSLSNTDVTAAALPVIARLGLPRSNVDLANTYADGDGTGCLSAFYAGASAEELESLYLVGQEQR